MGNSQNNNKGGFAPLVNCSVRYATALYNLLVEMEKEYSRPLFGIEVAQRFLSTKVGVTTSMSEQALYKTNALKYTILVLRDLARLDKVLCDEKMEIFGTSPSEKLMRVS
jgi:hypothetical protein